MGTKLGRLYASPVTTPQSERAREDQVQNTAGGYVFQTNAWDQLDRFLILGSEGNTYYISAEKLTRKNTKNVAKLIEEDGVRVVNRIVEISQAGRAPRNDPALFALALCIAFGDDATRRHAYTNLNKVARIGTHLFHFADYLKVMGKGWGKGLRKAIARWYLNRPVEKLELQAIKYKQRDGWSHRDMLRLAHPKSEDEAHNAILKYMIDGTVTPRVHIPKIRAASSLSDQSREASVVKAIVENGLPREAIPTKFLNSHAVWEALLPGMPMTALVRNLGKMTSMGLLTETSDASKLVYDKLSNAETIKYSRIHPLQVLFALATYGQGQGFRGSLSWSPVRGVVDSLDELFYASFGNIEPSGKRTMLGLDVSGSMGCTIGGYDSGSPVTCAMGAAAMAMVTARVEPRGSYEIRGFSSQFVDLGISPKQSLEEVFRKVFDRTFGATDCSLPMQYALKNNLKIDTFVVYTDNQTWHGRVHPFEALNEYRKKMGIPAKLIVVGMTANDFTIADPGDAGMLDVVGFDAGTPAIISDFSRAEML